MKIGFTGLELPEGSTRYDDPDLLRLVEKCKPKKVTGYSADFMPEEFVDVDAIVSHPDTLLDVLIVDMEICEMRLERSEDEEEKTLMKRCNDMLEAETPLCDGDFTEEEKAKLQASAMVSLKPVIVTENEDITTIIGEVFDKMGRVFFYTAGPKEVHSWDVKKETEMVDCAGRIHSDLSRGFIKGDLVTVDDFVACHNFNDCKKQGVVKVVDRDFKMEPHMVVEIRFNI